MARQSLGRGFDALIPQNLDQAILEEDLQRIQKLSIDDVRPNPDQPRREFDEQLLAELAESIKRHGVVQPIIVVKDSAPSGYIIVAGERRWRAAKQANLSQIPAITRSLKELERIELSLIENIQRVDLSPLDQALSLFKLQQQFNLSLEEISKKLGKAPSTISNLIRLLQLPEAARQALSEGKITEGHARSILALRNSETLQAELLSSILNNGWSVRQAEKFVSQSRQDSKPRQVHELTEEQASFVSVASQKIGLPVAIKRSVRGGRIVIKFKSDAQLQSLSEQLSRLDKQT